GLEGRLVHLVVGAQEYRVEASAQADAERSWESRRPTKGFSPRLDGEYEGLPELAQLGRDDVSKVGAKAAQLAFVKKLLPDAAPPRGFATPFSAYLRFLRGSGLDRKLARLLEDPGFRGDPARRATDLEALRGEMLKATVADDLVAALQSRITALLPRGRV